MSDAINSGENHSILVVDDQAHIIDSLTFLLESEGYEVIAADSPKTALQLINQKSVDVILTDMNFSQDTTSGKEGIEFVKSIRQSDSMLPIIVMTAWASIQLSVEAMQNGANDFVEKPWKNQRLLSLIRNQLKWSDEKRNNRRLSALANRSGSQESLIFGSSAMQSVMTLIERTAKSDANILLTGESGVGKSMIAEIIHQQSLRQQQPFVSVNMGALTDTLFASELFGHTKGAFTDAKSNRIGRFEMAHKGTLFMDEIANIPMALQAKLLRVLESGEFEPLGASKTQKVDVRIVSASNVDFDDEIAKGHFRQDLLYRLNTITIDIPPLRERIEDIEPLSEHFVAVFARKYRRPGVALSTAALNRLSAYTWPGNVRELAHCIERAVLVCANNLIEPSDFGISAPKSALPSTDMTLAEAEKWMIEQALVVCGKNVSEAAEKLGVSRNALYRRMEKYAIDAD